LSSPGSAVNLKGQPTGDVHPGARDSRFLRTQRKYARRTRAPGMEPLTEPAV
jgi:hypothetical protein